MVIRGSNIRLDLDYTTDIGHISDFIVLDVY